MNTEREKDSADDEQNENLESATPTSKRPRSEVGLVDTDEADEWEQVGGEKEEDGGHDADGREGQSQDDHLKNYSIMVHSSLKLSNASCNLTDTEQYLDGQNE